MKPTYRLEGEITAETPALIAEFLTANARRPADVIIMSPGGYAFAGPAIAALFRNHGNVTARFHGVGASSATLAAMGAKTILINSAAMIMVHCPSGGTYGTASDHRTSADTLEKIEQVYAEAYAARTGQPVQKILDLMRAETWMTAAEAVELGFADAVESEAEAVKIAAHLDLSSLTNPPPALLALVAKLPPNPNGEMTMLDHDKTPAPKAPDALTAQERDRAKRILTAVKTACLSDDLAMELIDAGTPLEAAIDRISAEWQAKGDIDRPMHGPRTSQNLSFDSPRAKLDKLVDAFTAKLDPTHKITMGAEYAGWGWDDLLMSQQGPLGLKPANFVEALTMAAHSTSDFPVAATEGAVANAMLRMIQSAAPAIKQTAHEVESTDYRPGKMIDLSAAKQPGAIATGITEVGEGGEVKAVTMDETGEAKPVARDFAGLFKATNRLITNANAYGDFIAQATRSMTLSVLEMQRNVLLAPLLANSAAGQTMSDTNPAFHSTRGNLAGTASAITVASLGLALAAMRKQRDASGRFLVIEPRFLLVSPDKEVEARQIVAQITAAQVSNVNPFSGTLDVLVEPGLTGNAWYLVADPSTVDGLAYTYLNGQSAPQVESRMGWETLGMEIRVWLPFDAKFVQPRSWYRNAGA
jgi:ATP-dependent protease ClpP protease subunit